MLFSIYAPIAQLVEQLPFKQTVPGSSPGGRTKKSRRGFLSLLTKMVIYEIKILFLEKQSNFLLQMLNNNGRRGRKNMSIQSCKGLSAVGEFSVRVKVKGGAQHKNTGRHSSRNTQYT